VKVVRVVDVVKVVDVLRVTGVVNIEISLLLSNFKKLISNL
jgi:hypothetical protein